MTSNTGQQAHNRAALQQGATAAAGANVTGALIPVTFRAQLTLCVCAGDPQQTAMPAGEPHSAELATPSTPSAAERGGLSILDPSNYNFDIFVSFHIYFAELQVCNNGAYRL